MIRFLYTLVFYLITPLILLRLCWRARRQPEYLRHVGERFGFYVHAIQAPILWVHAVSVGETRAAFPLIDALLSRYPRHMLLLTHMTPTGRSTGEEIVARYPGRIIQAYLPYDLPDACSRFFRHFHPGVGILMETEVWPNLLAGAQKQRTPVLLANARLSERSARRYAWLPSLARPAFASLSLVAAQSEADRDRLRKIGARHIKVCGNLKFDLSPDMEKYALGKSWKAAVGARRVWLAASTREGEESMILSTLAQQPLSEDILLVLVPRHPQRFDQVAQLLEKSGLNYQRRSIALPAQNTQVWLGDSMGEMAAYYSLADVALVGGSLLPFGGQNLIEAAACNCPVLVGPHTFNFAQATTDAMAAGAVRQLRDVSALPGALSQLLSNLDEQQNMRSAAQQFAVQHRGATRRTLSLIEMVLPSGLEPLNYSRHSIN